MRSEKFNDKTEGEPRKARPSWLKVKAPGGEKFSEIKKMIRSKSLHTVCEAAHCPNIGECWGCGTATFMILGNVCSRNCRFCAVASGKLSPPDPNEPINVAESIKTMKLKHAVITSVTRDDLPDGGAAHWAEVVRQIKKINPETTVEILIPDFGGDPELLKITLESNPDILNHNVETVPDLYRRVRPQANYERSLKVLKEAKRLGFRTKTGIMVGIGETFDQIVEVLDDLRAIDVDILTVGQYLQPSKDLLPVDRFVTPEEFREIERIALEKGFDKVESAPLVRSSYHAERHA